MDNIYVIRGRIEELYGKHSKLFDKAFQFILVYIHDIVSVKFCKYKAGNRRHDQQCDDKTKAYSPKYFLHIDSPVLTMSDIELKFVSKPPYRLNLPVGMLHFVQFGAKSLDM